MVKDLGRLLLACGELLACRLVVRTGLSFGGGSPAVVSIVGRGGSGARSTNIFVYCKLSSLFESLGVLFFPNDL